MCWTIDKNEFVKFPKSYHKIADKDIFVYKYGKVSEDDNCFHPYVKKCFSYKPNVLNEKIKINLEEDEDMYLHYVYYYIDEGYHSYSYCKEGLHLLSHHNGKFIIPKGSEYYQNEYGEIVSSNIMWTGEYEDNKFNKHID